MPEPTNSQPSSETPYAKPLDFRALYYTLCEQAWIITICILLAGFCTATYLVRTPKIYEAKVVLQVEQEEAKVINIQRIQQEDLQSLEFLKTVEQTLQSRSLFERVIERNSLAQNARFASAEPGKELSKEELVTKLAKMVEIKLRKGTRLIDISVEHTDPALTQMIASSIVKEYIRQNYEQNASATQIANEFLMVEARNLKQKLEASENALQAYKEETQSVSLEEKQNVVVEKLKELSAKVTEAKSLRIVHETAYKQVQATGSDVSALLAIQAVANDFAIVQIRSNIAKEESEIANLKQRYKEKHPKLIQAQSELAEWKNALQKAVLNVSSTLRSVYENAKTGEMALEQALREQEIAALELNKQGIRYNVLSRDVESDRALYQSVLSRIKETTVTKDLSSNKIRVVQEARIPERPVRPHKIKGVLAGTAIGVIGGILMALFLNALDRSLKTVDYTEEFLALPVLGAIPKFSGVPAQQRKLIISDDAESMEAESFRTLRTALSMLGRKEDRKAFLFTSAVPAEGKTFCSLNYALTLAQQGLRTLIIDCDLRRPMVEKALGEKKRGLGLTDYLTGQKKLEEIVHTTGVENFFYLPAGTQAPNPAELLAKTGIDGLMDEALQQFDRVIVDSAPIHAVSDTLLILKRIQTVCLVVHARKTPKNSVRRAVQILQEAGAPLAGVILNLVPRSRSVGYYYYDSHYDYAYRGDYGQKKACAA